MEQASDLAVIWAATASAGMRFILVVLILGLASWVIMQFSERFFGFDIKGALNCVESAAKHGNCWPLVALLLGGLASLSFIARGILS